MDVPPPGTASEKPLLDTASYRRLHRALRLEFWGLVYLRLLAWIPLALLAGPELQAAVDAASYGLLLAGMVLLLRLPGDGVYRALLGMALAGTFVTGAAEAAGEFRKWPPAVQAGLVLLTSLSTLSFAWALRRLVDRTRWWERVVRRIRRDTYLIAGFWAGTDAFVVALAFIPVAMGCRETMGVLLLTLVRVIPFIHLWGTMREMARNASVRHNQILRARKRARSALGRPCAGPTDRV